MKKSYTYFLIAFFLFAFTVIIISFREPEVELSLKLRQGDPSSAEWVNTNAAIEGLIAKVRSDPSDVKSMTALGLAYIQEGRISNNHSYYDPAALGLFEKVLKMEPENYEALVGKATVLLSQHHFEEALPVAEMGKKVSPHSSTIYGILTDIYVETGKYEKAVEVCDMMNAKRPDIRSYSRASYLREIHGDYAGAISAMKMAVAAGYPGMEQTEWCRQQLGRLFENTGDLSKAEECYDECIFIRPSFAWAYAGKGRIEKAKKNYAKSIEYLKQAQSLVDDFSFQQELTDVYRITNQQELASESARRTIELLGGMQGDDSEANHGHYADRELAYACIDAYDYMNAYRHAQIEYNRRPDNIDVNQTMAWVNYKLGRYEDAGKYIETAMKTGSKNPVLIYQAGLIKSKTGNEKEGSKLIEKSLALNPYLSPTLRWEKRQLLAAK